MRQLVAFCEKIKIRNTTKEYYQMKFHASLHRAEMPSLEEILGVTSETSTFDSKTEADLDEFAKKSLAQRKALQNV